MRQTLVGFSNLGDMNKHLMVFERQVQGSSDNVEEDGLAKTLTVFMVRGLFSKLQFCYAQFPVVNLKGHQLFDPFWEAFSRLKRLGFKVSHSIHVYLMYIYMYMYIHYIMCLCLSICTYI